MPSPAGTVLTTTGSPALDRIVVARGASRGGTVRASRVLDTPGGKAIHVALVAAALGAAAEVVAPLGGHRGARVRGLLAAEPIALWPVGCEGETRRTTTLVDPDDGDVVEILEAPPPLTSAEVTELVEFTRDRAAGKSVAVVAGSAPPRADDLPLRLALAAQEAGAFVVLDTSGAALEQSLDAGLDLVSPNLAEACALLGREVPDPVDVDELGRIARALRARGANAVWLSAGTRGTVLATVSEIVHLTAPAPVRRVNAVGCGDALLGGLAAGLAAGLGLADAAALGVAAATDKVVRLHPAQVDAVAVRDLHGRVVVCPVDGREAVGSV